MIVRRIIKWTLSVIGILLALLIIAVLVLRLTNPSPHRSLGWTTRAPMPDTRGEMASAVLDGRLFVIGGLKGLAGASNDVDIYDVDRDRWQVGPNLPAKLHHAAAATADGRIWVSGGARSVTDWTPTDALYTIHAGVSWQLATHMPEGRQGHAMVGLGHKLYVIGGVGSTARTLIYDTRTTAWSFGATLPGPTGRNHLRAVEWDGKIWAIGGRGGALTARVDVYDPKKDVWTRGPSLPKPMSAMAVGVLRGHLHVVGGEDPSFFGGGVLSDHFDLASGATSWHTRPKPSLPVHGAGFAVVGSRFVLAGGASRGGALSVLSWTNHVQMYDSLPVQRLAK